jgi:Na+/H+ antiporter NhaC
MENFGFWSLIPPIIAIVLAIRTKQVYVSLVFGIWLGWVIINGGNIIAGTFDAVKAIVNVFQNESSTQTIIFTLLIGSLIAFIQRSGGVEGFILGVNDYLQNATGKNSGWMRMKVQVLAALTGLIIFVESNISALTVGALYRPICDKLKISREKLAYLADSTSAPSSILVPLNAWGGFIMGLLILQGFEHPFPVLFKAIPFNFYPIIAVILVFYIVLSKKDYGPMRKAENRAITEGKVLADNAKPMISSEITFLESKKGIPPRSVNMLIPVLVMVLTMPLMMIYTGWNGVENPEGKAFFAKVFEAIGHSSGAASVLYSVIIALFVSSVLYAVQKLLTGKELIDLTLNCFGKMVVASPGAFYHFPGKLLHCFFNRHFLGYICYYDIHCRSGGTDHGCQCLYDYCCCSGRRCFRRSLLSYIRYHNHFINGFSQ